jgi:beta-lactam-binding protein with PASTA domain
VDLKFLRLCRRRKENLSWQERARFSSYLSSENGLVRFEHEVERETFEGLIDPYVEETLLQTRQMLEDAGARGFEPDTTVLIGGSTRVPLVERMLVESLPVAPLKFDKAEVAVALGAACYADVLWPSSQPKPARSAEPPPTVESEIREDEAEEEQRRREAEARAAEERRRREEEYKDGRMVGRPILEGDAVQEEHFAETSIDETEVIPSPVEVPNLTGKNAFQASSTLADLGLTLGDQKEVPSDTVPEGEIVEQRPEAGTEVASDNFVSVTVSSGSEEATTVPGLSDRSTEEAEPASSNARLVPADSRREENRRVGPKDSSRQTARGATVRSGQRAKLWIWVGLPCAVIAVGLIAAFMYSSTGEDTTEQPEQEASKDQPIPPPKQEEIPKDQPIPPPKQEEIPKVQPKDKKAPKQDQPKDKNAQKEEPLPKEEAVPPPEGGLAPKEVPDP